MTFDPLADSPSPLASILLIGGMMVVSCGAIMQFSEFMDERKDELDKDSRERGR